jgi:hypothetical protein
MTSVLFKDNSLPFLPRVLSDGPKAFPWGRYLGFHQHDFSSCLIIRHSSLPYWEFRLYAWVIFFENECQDQNNNLDKEKA